MWLDGVASCSRIEIEAQTRYLEKTPVSGIAQSLKEGRLILSKGIMTSIADLGMLKTEFGQIGKLIAPAQQGQRKFRLSEIYPLLQANPGEDDNLLRKIEEFIETDRRGEVSYNTTLMRVDEDFIIKDGNKRSIAFFERRKMKVVPINYPVFLVEAA